MSRGKSHKNIPDYIFKTIVELSATMPSREISKVIKEKYNYQIGYCSINKLLKETREERAEIFKDKFQQEVAEALPNDLGIIDNIINDLYEDYKSKKGKTDKTNLLLKIKLARTIGATIEIKFRNCGSQEQKQAISWEAYLDENEGDTYKF